MTKRLQSNLSLEIKFIGGKELAEQLKLECSSAQDVFEIGEHSGSLERRWSFCLVCPLSEKEQSETPHRAKEFQNQIDRVLNMTVRQRGKLVLWIPFKIEKGHKTIVDIISNAQCCDRVFVGHESTAQLLKNAGIKVQNERLKPCVSTKLFQPYYACPLPGSQHIRPFPAPDSEVISSWLNQDDPIIQNDTSLITKIAGLFMKGDDQTIIAPSPARSIDLSYRIAKHRIWRKITKDHALVQRLQTIASTLGVETNWNPFPKVTAFLPTFRLNYLDRAIANYKIQSYPNKELVVILHTDDDITDVVAKVGQQIPNGTFVKLGRHHTVGTCMNLALELATGEYAIKMDDDDYYGNNYLLDMILPLRSVSVDIFGKPPFFYYSQASDTTFLRANSLERENIIAPAWQLGVERVRMSGATHSGKVSLMRKIGFSETALGASDTAFFERCAKHDLLIGIWDGFGTVVFRGRDMGHHSWAASNKALQAGATKISQGIDEAKVFC